VFFSLLGQRTRLSERIRAQLFTPGRDRTLVASLRPLWPVLGPLIVPLLALSLLHLAFGLAQGLTESLALDVLEVVVLGAAWFLVILGGTTRFFLSRLRQGATRARMARQTIASLRLVYGYVLLGYVGLGVAERLVGRGYLYGTGVTLGWIGAGVVLLLLVRGWAVDVTTAHANRYPAGFVARRLAGRDAFLLRALLTPAAAVQLAVAGAGAAINELALRFEQSRLAVTYFARRRLARSANGPEVALEAFPEALRRTLSGRAPPEAAQEVPHYPQLDEVLAHLEEDRGLTVALIGERGIGKTSWMHALARRGDLGVSPIEVPDTLFEPPAVCRWLSRALGIEPLESVDAICAHIDEEAVRRVVLLDLCQNLVLRVIGGTRALETLVEVAARTQDHVVWVCSFSRFTWMYLERSWQGQDLFEVQVELRPWPEERIVELVKRRMAAAGAEASFTSLLVERLEGSALEDALLRTEEEYLRLLWDYADGNPRVALHFWLRSLVPVDGGPYRVRLFEAPDDDELEKLHDQSRFLLAALLLHENLTVHDASKTVGLEPSRCAALFAYLEAQGFIEEDGRAFRIRTHWYRAIVRHLRVKRLLFN
jgi:hypothetical protein